MNRFCSNTSTLLNLSQEKSTQPNKIYAYVTALIITKIYIYLPTVDKTLRLQCPVFMLGVPSNTW